MRLSWDWFEFLFFFFLFLFAFFGLADDSMLATSLRFSCPVAVKFGFDIFFFRSDAIVILMRIHGESCWSRQLLVFRFYFNPFLDAFRSIVYVCMCLLAFFVADFFKQNAK